MKNLLLFKFRLKPFVGRFLFISLLLFQPVQPAAAQTVDQSDSAGKAPAFPTVGKDKIKIDEELRRENLRNFRFSSNFERNPNPAKENTEAETNGFAEIDEKDRDRPGSIENSSKTEVGKSESGAASQTETREKFHWKPALIQSGIFLGIQHAYRMTQERTRRELGGAFFRDWRKSVRGLSGWQDSDGFFINYIAHPLQGGLTGRIFVNNSDAAKSADFGINKRYLNSRLKAFVWSAAWSTQFELGPFSEASFGNVGIRKKRGRSTMAYIDLVVTPTLGTGVLVAEDAIDKYILRNWLEKKNRRRLSTKIKILRCVLTPTTCFANILRGKAPWKRDFR